MSGKDWFPGIQDAALQMAAAWLLRLSTEGASWGVPAAVIIELHGLDAAARAALDLAVKSERAPVINARIDAAFERLREKMRDIKKRRFRSKSNGGYALFPPGPPAL
jgi:hypothetical protein